MYFSINAIYITKYANNGVNPFVIESAAVYITCENSGLILAFISNGTILPDKIIHFVCEPGQNKLAIATNNITANISPIPLNPNPPIILEINAVITSPILLSSKTLINNDAKKIRTIILPIPSKE